MLFEQLLIGQNQCLGMERNKVKTSFPPLIFTTWFIALMDAMLLLVLQTERSSCGGCAMDKLSIVWRSKGLYIIHFYSYLWLIILNQTEHPFPALVGLRIQALLRLVIVQEWLWSINNSTLALCKQWFNLRFL